MVSVLLEIGACLLLTQLCRLQPALKDFVFVVQSSLARAEGRNEEAKVREDQREENVDAHRGTWPN